jgi:signal transduction histidine kinase
MVVSVGRQRFGAGVARAFADVRRALPFLAVGLATGLVSLLLVPVAVGVLLIGWPALPAAARALRRWADLERRRLRGFTGRPVAQDYPRLDGPLPEQIKAVLTDPSARRDLVWLAVHGLTGTVLGLIAVGLPLGAVNAMLVPLYWWALPADRPVTSPYPVTSWGRALAMPLIALGYAALTLLLVPRFGRWQATWSRTLLSPAAGARLRAQVAELTASRAAALEAHGTELRRIERDLHDGTQNRLVGVVLHLGIAERALHRDPEAALPLLLRAQDAATAALAELRHVVRTIYPPVLTERGLDGAVAALVARCPVPCTVTTDGLRRAPAAVESAAYFVIAEALTNIAKHSGAHRAEVRLSTRGDQTLVVEVFDDGHGGADEAAGSGLLGIRRRVAALGGHTELVSPDGGPTLLQAELPCGS